jgi:hypothetical protein
MVRTSTESVGADAAVLTEANSSPAKQHWKTLKQKMSKGKLRKAADEAARARAMRSSMSEFEVDAQVEEEGVEMEESPAISDATGATLQQLGAAVQGRESPGRVRSDGIGSLQPADEDKMSKELAQKQVADSMVRTSTESVGADAAVLTEANSSPAKQHWKTLKQKMSKGKLRKAADEAARARAMRSSMSEFEVDAQVEEEGVEMEESPAISDATGATLQQLGAAVQGRESPGRANPDDCILAKQPAAVKKSPKGEMLARTQSRGEMLRRSKEEAIARKIADNMGEFDTLETELPVTSYAAEDYAMEGGVVKPAKPAEPAEPVEGYTVSEEEHTTLEKKGRQRRERGGGHRGRQNNGCIEVMSLIVSDMRSCCFGKRFHRDAAKQGLKEPLLPSQ